VYAWSYFQPLLVEQFRWTNTETSWAFSLTICCLGLSAAWGGINLARIGPRKLAVAGGLLFGSAPQGQLSRSRHRLLVSTRYPRARARLHLQLSRQRRPVHTAAHPAPGLGQGAAPRCATPKSPRGKRRTVSSGIVWRPAAASRPRTKPTRSTVLKSASTDGQ
jgi:hypothetical protein